MKGQLKLHRLQLRATNYFITRHVVMFEELCNWDLRKTSTSNNGPTIQPLISADLVMRSVENQPSPLQKCP